MANIDRITSVQIALRSRGILAQTFSDMVLVDIHTGPERFAWITAPDDLLEGWGLTVDSDLYKAAQVWFSQIPHPPRVGIGRRGSQELIDEALAEIRRVNNQWYGFSPVSHNVNDILRAAQWAEANEKLHFNAISDIDVTTSGGAGVEPATQLMTGNYYRTAWWYNPSPDQWPEVASAARGFSVLPGADIWHMATLAGVQSTDISETAYNFISAKKGNTFEPFRNDISLSQNGFVAAGERIDVIRGRDWQAEEIRVTCFQGQIDRRIPYTDPGISLFKTWMTAALDLGLRRGVLAPPMENPDKPDTIIPSFLTWVPARAQISSNQVASRILVDVGFRARLAGAINAVQINGEMTYDNIG